MWGSAVQVCSGLPIGQSHVIRETHIRKGWRGHVNERWGCDIILEGGLAQLARAPALQAGGQRFESVILHSPARDTFPGME